jgi:hypothetical protein
VHVDRESRFPPARSRAPSAVHAGYAFDGLCDPTSTFAERTESIETRDVRVEKVRREFRGPFDFTSASAN